MPPSTSPAPRPGELRFASVAIPPGSPAGAPPARVVLVIKVDLAAGFVLAMLTTNEVELAGGTDLVLPADELGLPFPLCLEVEEVGALWIDQLQPPLARLPDGTFREILELRHGSLPRRLRRYLGLPIAGPRDPRWQLKQEETAALQGLSAACAGTLLDRFPPPAPSGPEHSRLNPPRSRPPTGVLNEYGVAETLGAMLMLELAEERHSLERVTDRTNLPSATVQAAVTRLVEHGFVVEDKAGRGTLRVNEDRACAMGISIRPDHVLGVLTNLAARDLVPLHRRPLPGTDVATVVDAVTAVVDHLRAAPASGGDEILGVGVELSGHIDGRTGEVVFSPDLRASHRYWQYVALAEMIQERTGLSVVAENDANALALHEMWFGDGVDLDDFVVVLIGEKGVGAGLVVDGRLVHGSEGIAGELGHLVLEPGGQLCRCGNRGCLETIVSESAILHAMRESGAPAGDLQAAAEAARDGDRAAISAVRHAGDVLGRGISMLLNLVGPSHVIVFGPPQLTDTAQAVRSAEIFMRAVDRSVGSNSFSFAAKRYKLLNKPLHAGLGAIGAASAVLGRIIPRSANG